MIEAFSADKTVRLITYSPVCGAALTAAPASIKPQKTEAPLQPGPFYSERGYIVYSESLMQTLLLYAEIAISRDIYVLHMFPIV